MARGAGILSTIVVSLTVPGVLTWLALPGPIVAQRREVPLEYRLKAEYLLNFTRFVEWPDTDAGTSQRTICVVSENPFRTVLTDLVRAERANGGQVRVRVVRQTAGCHVLFIPRTVPHEP